MEVVMKLHVCNNIKKDGKFTGYFLCNACSFAGILEEAIQHITENQFQVQYKPKPKVSWTKAHPHYFDMVGDRFE